MRGRCVSMRLAFGPGSGLGGGFLFVALIGDPCDADNFLALAGVEHLHTARAAGSEGNALDRDADRLPLGGGQHDLIFHLDREGRDQSTATYGHITFRYGARPYGKNFEGQLVTYSGG